MIPMIRRAINGTEKGESLWPTIEKIILDGFDGDDRINGGDGDNFLRGNETFLG